MDGTAHIRESITHGTRRVDVLRSLCSTLSDDRPNVRKCTQSRRDSRSVGKVQYITSNLRALGQETTGPNESLAENTRRLGQALTECCS